jgi:kynurenine formamidase
MRIRSFIIAYALVLAILLFADRRPHAANQDRYSHVVDLTDGQETPLQRTAESRTRIIAPGALIPGTWNAGQIPAGRLVAPLVVLDLAPTQSAQISLDDIAAWEAHHGMIPQGSVVAIRTANKNDATTALNATPSQMPIARDAALFLVDARYTIGLAVETPVDLSADRTLARQLALHGAYVLEGTSRFSSLPATGSLIMVAPAKNKQTGKVPVRILAMVR